MTNIDLTNTFAPPESLKILSNHIFHLIGRETIYQVSLGQVSALRATYCTRYGLEPVDRGLKIGQLPSFQDILTPTTPNLHKVLTSKLKLKLTIWRRFYWV